MLSSARFRQGLRLGTVVLALTAVAACDDDPIEPEPEPEIAAVQLVLGSQTVTITDAGVQTPASVTLPVGTTTVTAQFLRANGQPEPLVTADEFRLEMVTTGAPGVTFTSTGPFSGSLTTTTPGTKQVRVQAFHIEEQHADFERDFSFTVAP